MIPGRTDDRHMVEAAARGDGGAMAAMYDAYAPALYAYCRSLLGTGGAADPAADPAVEAAADAVCDTFAVAARHISRLREPQRLRPWLYGLARWQCLVRVPDDGSGNAAPSGAGSPYPVADGAGGTAGSSGDASALVRSAVGGLDHGDREVLELAYRHRLADDDLAAALGVSGTTAGARLAAARARFEGALAALLAPAGISGTAAIELLGDLPLPPPPAELRDEALWAAYQAAPLVRDGHVVVPPFGRRGFPLQPNTPQSAVRRWALAAAAVLLVLTAVGAAGGGMLLMRDGDEPTARAAGTAGPTQAARSLALPTGDIAMAPVPRASTSPSPATPSRTRSRVQAATGEPAAEPTRQRARRNADPQEQRTTPGLAVSPSRVDLGTGSRGQVVLTARGGAVLWGSGTSHEALSVSPDSGALPEGGRVKVAISLDRRAVDGPGSEVVRFATMRGEVHDVPVTWS